MDHFYMMNQHHNFAGGSNIITSQLTVLYIVCENQKSFQEVVYNVVDLNT